MENGIYGLIGGSLGAGIGVLAAAWATIRSIRSCRTPAARRFMIRLSIMVWCALAVGALVIVLHVLGMAPDWAYLLAMTCMIGAIWPLNRLVRAKMVLLEHTERSGDASE